MNLAGLAQNFDCTEIPICVQMYLYFQSFTYKTIQITVLCWVTTDLCYPDANFYSRHTKHFWHI